MIPALIVPVLNGPDLLAEMLASVDVPVGLTVIIDNGQGVADDVAPGAWHVRLPHNLGVAASWNLGMKLAPDAPWWAIVNHDVVFAPGDLERLAAQVEAEPGTLWTTDGMAAFAISAQVLARVGYFDENYHPAYVEDCDYERRCELAGVPIEAVSHRLRHRSSSTIAAPQYRDHNARTFGTNVDYHREKWGGGPRGGEHLTTPFGRSGSLADWTLDPGRLARNAWK